MNKIIFLYKFYVYKKYGGRYNWHLLFPFAGVIIGTMTVALTLSIMEGMEYTIFNKLKNVTFPAKLMNINKDSNDKLEGYLIENKIDYLSGIEDQVLIMNNTVFRLAMIHGIENFNMFQKELLGNNLLETTIDSKLPMIYIGRSLAAKLDIALGDTVDIAAPKQINIFTGLPPKRSMVVGGLYELEVLDYDIKHIFTNYSSVKDFLPDNRSLYYLHEIPGESFIKFITQHLPEIYLNKWDDDHHSFISAMRLEKIAYSIVGFLIVFIASFTLMSMMSLSVIQKVPQIGILKAMGAKQKHIASIFIFQALITWIIGSITGIILSLIIIDMDKHYHLMQIFFPGTVFFDFPLILQNEYILLIMCVSFILLLSSSLYPSIKAAHLDAVQSIGYRQ